MNVLDWARKAEIGEMKVYYTGDIDTYRNAHDKESFWSALEAHEKGLVFLSQKRVRYGLIAYRATRVSKEAAHTLSRISSYLVEEDEARRQNIFVRRHPASSSMRL